jgi:hypothetical protein
LSHFADLPLRKELVEKKAFDDSMTAKFKEEFKKFTKNYVLKLKDYDLKSYGSSIELEVEHDHKVKK